jgi:sulfate transport system ATP-binding protein
MSIEVKNVTKYFGPTRVLNQVNLRIASGELVALLGPSGCGKTSLLRIIAGLETADSGSIYLEDDDATLTGARERQVGFVFQHYALFRHMSVFENVAFGLRVKPKKERPSEDKIHEKVHELLDMVQLKFLKDRFPSQLSGGQRQRIALARALAIEPKVLLLDEPFGALDAKVRKELRKWLRRLHDDLHVTSVFVTHDQEEALEVSDTVVLMNQGQLEQIGTPQEVYDHPATPFAYGFLGNVNRFEGLISQGQFKFGDLILDQADTSGLEDQSTAIAFARPTDLDIVSTQSKQIGIAAVIDRILSFGPTSKIELSATQSYSDAGRAIELEVHWPRNRVSEAALKEGMHVKLIPNGLRIFGH